MKLPAPSRRRVLLLLLLGLGTLFWVLLDLPCALRSVTGIPCLACGLTRAWRCVLRLDIAGAFRIYPMFWSIPILDLFLFLDFQGFAGEKWNICLCLFLVLALIFIYFCRLFGLFHGLAPL